MDMWNLKQTWKKAKEKWSHMIEEIQNLRSSQEGRTHRIFSNGSYQSPWRMGDAGDVRVVVTQIADELDCIDELVLENELTIYRLAGYPIKVAPQDKEKEFVRPLWAIEVFQNGRLARQITYYLQPRFPDKSPSDAGDTEAQDPSNTELEGD